MNITDKDILVDLYKRNSKHSGYQILPNSLKSIIEEDVTQFIPRYETQRLDWLKAQVDFSKMRVLDIGGNTGYFSFETLDLGAREVVYVEGNKNHAEFVEKAARLLNKNLKVYNRYFDFSTDFSKEKFDVVLLFNVIHHLGDDFGNSEISMDEAKQQMSGAINYFSDKCDLLVLQMGFCWKGDRTKLLFENGTKEEMITFIQGTCESNWDVQSIGISEIDNEETVYRPLSEINLQRDDSMGEFRNRPIFILKSK
ncbi:class I SAM-dependent methyltransferase [Algoriphagus algorifonticola]|uniref:class I SAM-dependent methyltransferase n=1 Tax=Algoriphagus algorifonticola TaxID=2593007 RepID=UPI00119E77DD|nr:class I SAM-dependent methyltransferase [Algoriphagus algorifonticola]